MKFFLSSVLFLSSICCNAQIMPRIGFTMTTGNFPGIPSDINTSPITGFVTGAEGRFDITDQYGLAIDLHLTQKGFQEDWNVAGGGGVNPASYHSKYRLFYGELVCLPYFNVSNFYFMAGPGVSYGLGGKVFLTGTDNSTGQNYSYVYQVDFIGNDSDKMYAMDRQLTLSGTIGAGVIVRERLLVDLRYQLAAADHPRNKSLSASYDYSGLYHSLQFSCSFRILK